MAGAAPELAPNIKGEGQNTLEVMEGEAHLRYIEEGGLRVFGVMTVSIIQFQ